VGVVEFLLGGLTPPLDPLALHRHKTQEQRAEHRDSGGDLDQPGRDQTDFPLHVVQIQSRTHDPAPRFELLNERLLGLQAVRIVLPLPDVFDVRLLPITQRVYDLHEDPAAQGVLKTRQVVAVEIRPVGVHDHAGVQVGDPEVVLPIVAVAQVLNAGDRGPTGFVLREAPEPDLGLVFRQDAESDVGQLPDHVALPFQQSILE
jgi:hypothetical protein